MISWGLAAGSPTRREGGRSSWPRATAASARMATVPKAYVRFMFDLAPFYSALSTSCVSLLLGRRALDQIRGPGGLGIIIEGQGSHEFAAERERRNAAQTYPGVS